jgi:hypothetical protein
MDPKAQKINLNPDTICLTADNVNDRVTIRVSFDAILDSTSTDEILEITDDTVPSEDPDITRKLAFNQNSFAFRRQSNLNHSSNIQELVVRLVPKDPPPSGREGPGLPTIVRPLPGAPKSPGKFKKLKAMDRSHPYQTRAKVSENATHITAITMVSAGKGDSYIVSDQVGSSSTAVPVRMLVDGGYKGTWNADLKDILTSLGISRGKLDAVQCTHFDADHIEGKGFGPVDVLRHRHI